MKLLFLGVRTAEHIIIITAAMSAKMELFHETSAFFKKKIKRKRKTVPRTDRLDNLKRTLSCKRHKINETILIQRIIRPIFEKFT